jgi:hypothetical protein
MDIFYAATSITLGNGRMTPFWAAPWLGGRKPIDVAPLIYNISKRKSWKVCDALNGNAWVHKITLDEDFSMDHLLQFVELWSLLLHVHLDDQVEDSISWNLTANWQYSAKSAYEVQFIGSTLSIMHKTVWKVWATPKAKFFAWLLLQNRIWTADRLQKKGVGPIVVYALLQAIYGVGAPSLCGVSIHRSALDLVKDVAWHPRHSTNPLGGLLNQALVEHHDKRVHGKPQSPCLPHFLLLGKF